MKPKNPKSTNIAKSPNSYIVGENSRFKDIISSHSKAIDSYDGIRSERTVGFANELVTDVIVRQPFTRSDYDYFRPNENIPTKFKDLVRMCRAVYKKIGIVRNVMDLMTDFTTEGLEIIHPDESVNSLFNAWMKKSKLSEVCDEFVRHLLIEHNVVVKRITAKLTKPIEAEWTKVKADTDIKVYKDGKTLEAREIPWRYMFLNILSLEWMGGELAKLAGKRTLGVELSRQVINSIKNPLPENKELIDNLPKDFKELIKLEKNGIIPLDMSKIYIAQHKKDTWEDWASPALEAILSDIMFKQKLRQAEVSALDGLINVIRLWKVGDHKEGVLPDQGIIDKLVNVLSANTGGGSVDLVWDSMIEMEAHYPPVKDILGSEKFDQVNRDILVGLGVPEVLLGGKGANFSNSFIQLKTIVEKLKGIREKLYDFISNEIHIICTSFNIEKMPIVRFANIVEDEDSTKKLIVGLLDRGVISIESVLEVYGQDFFLETQRMKKEKKLNIEVLGPFTQDPAEEGMPGGRPAKTKDTTTRKTRTAKPRTKASLNVMGMDIIQAIDDYVIPIYMKDLNVNNARKLTNNQKEEINSVRISTLACITSLDKIDKDGILKIFEEDRIPNKDIVDQIQNDIDEFVNERGELPTLSQRKLIESTVWANLNNLE